MQPAEETQTQEAAPAPEAEPAAEPAQVPEAVTEPTAPVGPAATAAQQEPKKEVEEILVTGSRIRRMDLTTAAPVTVLTKDQLISSGKVSIGDILQMLPAQSNAINTSVNNGGTGATRVNLRGLGPARTLVLVNGRRFVPGGLGADDSVDLNSIPSAAIERVEVLKDGASAVYGSDAISGVVNLITRSDWTGTEFSALGGVSSRGDGAMYDLNMTTGAGSERGSFVFSAGFYNQEKTMAGERDFSKEPFGYWIDATGSDAFGWGATGPYTMGSGTSPNSRIILGAGERDLQNGNATYNQMIADSCASDDGCAASYIYDAEAGGFRPYTSTLLPREGGDGYNYQPDNYLVTPQQRIQLFALGQTNLGDAARGYFEASYVNRNSKQLLAAEPLMTQYEFVTVDAANIYNPFGRDFTMVNRRLMEFGGRQTEQDIETFRVVGGFDGTLGADFGLAQGWFWDLSLNYGRNHSTDVKNGNIYLPNLADALGPSYMEGDQAYCGTPGSPIEGCVPLNLFGGEGSITPEMVRGLTYSGTMRGLNEMIGFQANTSGELFSISGDRAVGLAVGYEFRRLRGSNLPDPITAKGLTSGNKSEATGGEYDVNEGYAELSIPLVSDLPGIDDLELTAATRVFDYTTFGSDLTYKFGGRWRIIPDVTVRGTYSTAFRAPSISELYSGQYDSFPNVKDPCSAAGNPNCGEWADTGTGDTAMQLLTRYGGNPDLDPETAKIFTLGAVFEPTMVQGLSVTVDYYSVAMDSVISTIGPSVILQSCYAPPAGVEPKYCELVERDPSSGYIDRIMNTNQNVGEEETAGIDLSVRYSLPSAFGTFGFSFDGTWLQKYDRTLADGTVIEGKGTFDLNAQGTYGVFPDYRFNTGLAWSFEGLSAALNSRFIGSFKECGEAYSDDDTGEAIGGDFSGGGLCYIDDTYSRTVDAYVLFDLYASYRLPTTLGNTTLALGVNNLLDTEPGKIYNGFTAQSDPSAYDFMGRYVYARIEHAF